MAAGMDEGRRKAVGMAAERVYRAVLDIVSETAGTAFPGAPAPGGKRDAKPLAGLRAAREVELAARYYACRFIREAREDGLTWGDISTALLLGPGAEEPGVSPAHVAYSYAVGDPELDSAARLSRVFPWECPVCSEVIRDRGPADGPADEEPGHAAGCARLAAAVAAHIARPKP
jgi:hypothetical protein